MLTPEQEATLKACDLGVLTKLTGKRIIDVIRGWSGDLAVVTDGGFVCLAANANGHVVATAFDKTKFGDQESERLRARTTPGGVE